MMERYGYWKDKYDNKYDNHLYVCSVCGEEALYRCTTDELGIARVIQVLTPGCPYCLSRMEMEAKKSE